VAVPGCVPVGSTVPFRSPMSVASMAMAGSLPVVSASHFTVPVTFFLCRGRLPVMGLAGTNNIWWVCCSH